jgi:hypothetical protein
MGFDMLADMLLTAARALADSGEVDLEVVKKQATEMVDAQQAAHARGEYKNMPHASAVALIFAYGHCKIIQDVADGR